ncbi:MAG: c-type cytochrome biogenesis protein CcmI [Pseudomonadota bacterium]
MFWIIAVLLILLGLAFVILPMLSSHKTDHAPSRTSLNRSIYQAKVAELDADMESGLLDENEYQNSLHDLQQTLLEDANVQDSTPVYSGKSIVSVSVVSVLLPLVSIGLYQQISTNLSPDQIAEHQTTLSQAQSIQASIIGLEEKLKQNPSDFDGWVMLGQSYFVMGDFDAAKQAYLRASELASNADPNVLVQIAEASAYSNSEQFGAYEKDLLARALQIDPDNERALWYAGFADYTNLDFAGAVEYWQQLVNQVPADRPDVKASLTQFLNDAKQKAGLSELSDSELNESVVDNARVINVSVNIDSGISAKAQPADILFIYARAHNGPKMPLSLARLTVADLPVNVTLSKEKAMMPNLDIDTFDQVEVLARVSKSGQAISQPGDLISQPVIVDFSGSHSAEVDLIIGSVIE